ncbi:MAG: hypothetical protein AAF490_32045, partial [Chloroflexota bacterium]
TTSFWTPRACDSKAETRSRTDVRWSAVKGVFVRSWRAIIEMPNDLDPDLFLVSTASRYYAKGVAFAALGQHAMAEQQVELFETAVSKIPETRRFFNNKALDVLAIGREMMRGEMAYHRGNHNEAFAHLRQAVWLNDNLFYTEPWAWMHPPRHALGALLLEHGHVEEAEAVYRADLGLDSSLSRPLQHPNNVWSLHGYVECLERLGRNTEVDSIRLQLNLALARADVEIKSSCFCRMDDCCD